MTTLTDDLKPYTPRLFNKTTQQRFRRDRWRRLCAHVGGSPSEVQKLRINMIIGLEWTIARLNAKADTGELTEHAMRQLMACFNHVRMLTAALGPAVQAQGLTLEQFMAAKALERAVPEVLPE